LSQKTGTALFYVYQEEFQSAGGIAFPTLVALHRINNPAQVFQKWFQVGLNSQGIGVLDFDKYHIRYNIQQPIINLDNSWNLT
jgi:hypothetical protein